MEAEAEITPEDDKQQLVVTNGGGGDHNNTAPTVSTPGTIVVTETKEYLSSPDHAASTSPVKSAILTSPNTTGTDQPVVQTLNHALVGQSYEIFIKAEPLDPMPPLASPATVMEHASSVVDGNGTSTTTAVGGVTGGTVVTVSSAEKMRDMEASPPATVISLTPAQPYHPARVPTQLTFATTPAYDISTSGPYTVQVNTGVVSPPQYATVAGTGNGGATAQSNGGTVYLTTDYVTYRDYYSVAATGPAGPTATLQAVGCVAATTAGDQYQTVRQQLSAAPAAVTYTTATNVDSIATEGAGSFLDRYLRQGQQVVTTVNGTTIVSGGSDKIPTATTINGGLTVDLPSPDSGIGGEATVTPRAVENGTIVQAATILPVSSTGTSLDQSTTTVTVIAGPATPGSTGSNSNASTPSTSTTKSSRRSWHEYGRNSEVDKVQIPKIFCDVGFKYYLESPISTSQRREDDRITYINKGQFYGVTLEYIPDPSTPLKSTTVKSLMLLVFREEKSHEDEIKAWQFWHSRQHSIKQRILDADTKNSSGIVGPIEEVTHNSIAFYWNPLEGPAKINIAVQCLSTDFSNQKGVKGLPLHLQIDTFDDHREGAVPINRGYCQVKVFCDKGAERKTRDEERRAAKRKLSATGNGRKKIEDMYHPVTERSEFYTMSDVLKPPVLFTPDEQLEKQINAGEINFYATGQPGTELNTSGYESSSNSLPSITPIAAALVSMDKKHIPDARVVDPLTASVEMTLAQPPVKRIKLYPPDRILIYAKQENEEVFHPLHLVPPSLVGLAVAIQNKYKLEAKNIRHIFKRCRKGITVQMDDDMVKHYSNEETCLLEVHQVDEHTHDITLVEYEPN